MQEPEAYGVLIGIDTSDKIGATSVYGMHEIEKILNAGAAQYGYKAEVVPVDDWSITRPDKRIYSLMVLIKPKEDKHG